MFLPPYLLGFISTEETFSKIKGIVGGVQARTLEVSWWKRLG